MGNQQFLQSSNEQTRLFCVQGILPTYPNRIIMMFDYLCAPSVRYLATR